MPKLVNKELWYSNIEIDEYLSDPHNAIAHVDDQADVMATIGEQLRTDDLVDDDFRSALSWDAGFCADIYYNSKEILDLCDIVEAVEKGHILYG